MMRQVYDGAVRHMRHVSQVQVLDVASELADRIHTLVSQT